MALEGNFRAGEHEPALNAVLADLPVRVVQVLCTTAENVRRARLTQRQHDPTRHPGHRDAHNLDRSPASDAFLELPGARLHLDTTDAASSEAECLTSLEAVLAT